MLPFSLLQIKNVFLISVTIFGSFLISNAKVALSPELVEVVQRKANIIHDDSDNRVIVAFKAETDPSMFIQKAPIHFLTAEAYRAAVGALVINEMNRENWELEQVLLEFVREEQIVRRLPIGNAFVLEGLTFEQAQKISQLERTVLLTLSTFTPDHEDRVINDKTDLNKCANKKKLKRTDFPFSEPVGNIHKWKKPNCDPLLKAACQQNIPWNIKSVNIPQAWSQGINGRGIVYGVIDTGVSYKHPVLQANYLGLKEDGSYDHNYAWYDAIRKKPKLQGRDSFKDQQIDELERKIYREYSNNLYKSYRNPVNYVDDGYEADCSSSSSSSSSSDDDNFEYESLEKVMSVADKCGFGVNEPCDAGGHGTHVASIAVGSFGIGTAPEARWMACRTMVEDLSREEESLACLNFFLAPHDLNGKNPRPEMRPHVIGNSYGWSSWAEVTGAGINLAVKRLESAGTVMVFAAGNSGPMCGTIHSAFSFNVGATTEHHTLATFSSRGPWTVSSLWALQYRIPVFSRNLRPLIIKPEISAPGHMIIGAIGAEHMSKMSGTSMATPHVAGSIALLLQACPSLIGRSKDIQELLQNTARPLYVPFGVPPCGLDDFTSIPNNFFGHGELDIEAAINSCRLQNKTNTGMN